MAQLLISNVNDGPITRTSTFTAGDVIDVRPDGFKFGRRECIQSWIEAGNRARDFPNSFIIVDVDMPLVNAKELNTQNRFPIRLSNYNLDLSKLPERSRTDMDIDSKGAMRSGRTRHTLSLNELDTCLIPRAGNKRPSDF